jgi:predicted anti-sigma-YlaC factor YlaD
MSQGCAEWRGDLGAYVIGALNREERIAMRRHLMACPACRADYVDLLPVRDWLARTRRHLAACRACRADYEDLLHLRLAHCAAADPETGR